MEVVFELADGKGRGGRVDSRFILMEGIYEDW